MADWKFGTILREPSDRAIIMVVGRGGDFMAEDGYRIEPDKFWGLVLFLQAGSPAWGPIGGRTWIPDGPWQWDVLDED